MFIKNNKGQYTVGMLGSLAIMLVIAAIIMSIGAQIVSDVGAEIDEGETEARYADQQCGVNGSAAYNATCGGAEGVETMSSWLDTIALIVVAAVVIGIIVTSFRGG